jgi:hypothetical protein
LLTVVTTVGGSFVTRWETISCSKITLLSAGNPPVSQSVIKQSIYLTLRTSFSSPAINKKFSGFVFYTICIIPGNTQLRNQFHNNIPSFGNIYWSIYWDAQMISCFCTIPKIIIRFTITFKLTLH